LVRAKLFFLFEKALTHGVLFLMQAIRQAFSLLLWKRKTDGLSHRFHGAI
jgi:hypothetical protein